MRGDYEMKFKQFFQYQQNELTHQKTHNIYAFLEKTFTGNTQSQKILNKKIWKIWDQETTVSSQCSQHWLTSPMHEREDPYFWYIRTVWRYQTGNQNLHIEKGRTTKWPEDKRQTTIYKNRHINHDNMKWVKWVETYLVSIE